ncbi:putative tpr domain-containing protein [Phaeoacremonium minimum UCRPA7]|uniref:Putative tpr domain-containing protein n=1 Tax=Phaeoacremonium minimum (strain UCR-PA7) TaxID=1286976 RepID=R8BNZ7_PHAM7|nr:putative tpr domain-containing protein [Phaeoacremonium minimum UCRPA7]EOO01123.1 putative tpr domain-containing protein [Phaeoacremonium minimum UCRPA7]
MAPPNTLFMTPEESERVQKSVKDRIQKCREQSGQQREPSEPKGLTQQAISSSLMQDFASAAFGLGAPKKSQDTMVAYAVGNPYPPCTTELAKLEPMKLSELRMETHHRGKVLALHRSSPVVELKASSWAAVKGDSADDSERLEVFLHTSKMGRNVLDLGSDFLVKEPYYTLNNLGETVIRIDHPSDLIITAYSDNQESWREVDTRQTPATKTPTEYKQEGNTALEKQNFAKAHVFYTQGLKAITDDDEANKTLRNDLHRNRSHVNLLLQRFDEARTDALSSLTHSEGEKEKSLDAKAYYRAGSAAYSLGDFADAKGFFEEQQKLEPENQYAKLYLRKIKLRLDEEATGNYDLNKVVKTLSKTQGRADVANFTRNTEVKESPGAGRGMFATRDIEPKEIIMCEKAFIVVWSHEKEAFSALTCDLRDDAAIRVYPAGLHKAVVQKLLNNPSQANKFLDTFGDYKGLGNKLRECDGEPLIDTFQVHDQVQRNAFGTGQQTEDEDVSNASTGFWLWASYTNHSCVPNAKKDHVGDLLIIRATRKIAAGEEITHSYDESSDYEARTASLQRTWGFKCRCALCAAEEADGADVRAKRMELEGQADGFLQRENPSGARRTTVLKARRLLNSLKATYDEKRYKDLPRKACLGLEQWLEIAPSR